MATPTLSFVIDGHEGDTEEAMNQTLQAIHERIFEDGKARERVLMGIVGRLAAGVRPDVVADVAPEWAEGFDVLLADALAAIDEVTVMLESTKAYVAEATAGLPHPN